MMKYSFLPQKIMACLPRPHRLQSLAAVSLGLAWPLTSVTMAQAQSLQQQGLEAVATMMMSQRTMYQKNGQWLADVPSIEAFFGAKLPPQFNYAVRTTTTAAYSYVIPTTDPGSANLKSFVGAAYLIPGQGDRIRTIICQNNAPGQIRPADPRIIRGATPADPPYRLACDDSSTEISASQYSR